MRRQEFEAVRAAIEKHSIPVEEATIGYVPTTSVELDVDNGRRMRKMLDLLEENEDVQDVYSNDQIPEEVVYLICTCHDCW